MIKWLEKSIIILGIILFLFLYIFGNVIYYETLAPLAASLLPFLILPIRNLILSKKRRLTASYAIVEILVILFALGMTTVLFLEDCSILPSSTMTNRIWIASLLCILVASIPGFFMKKEREKRENHRFSYFLLLTPGICTFFSDTQSLFDLIFIAVFLVGWLKNKDIYIRVEYQKWYAILFVLAFFSRNLLAIILLPILYFQLDRMPNV